MENYWAERSTTRLAQSEITALKYTTRVLDIYTATERKVNKQIQSVYENYAKKGVLDRKDLQKALSTNQRIQFTKKLKLRAAELGLDPEELLDERYLFRLTRLEAMKAQIQLEIKAIARQENAITTRAYKRVVSDSYASIQQDMPLMGINPAFSTISKDVVDTIVRQNWSGKHYSTRIYSNVDDLAKQLPDILGSGMLSGESLPSMAKVIRERFGVSQYRAMTLIRTETAFMHNRAELQSYKDDNVKQYEFVAILDGRTTEICEGLDGRRFKTKDAMVGKNYPPMHVKCRSTTAPIA